MDYGAIHLNDFMSLFIESIITKMSKRHKLKVKDMKRLFGGFSSILINSDLDEFQIEIDYSDLKFVLVSIEGEYTPEEVKKFNFSKFLKYTPGKIGDLIFYSFKAFTY